MRKPFILGGIGLVVVALAVGFVVLAKTLVWIPRLEISEESWDFGTVKAASDVQHTFTIKNTGNAALTVNAYLSCPACMYANLEKTDIPPKGETRMVLKIIVTEPERYVGFVSLDSNDPVQPEKKITVTGTFIK